MNPTGVLLGLSTLCLIGVGFFWVIKLEYYLGANIWKWVLALGMLLCLASLLVPSFWGSAMLGVFGGSVVWGASELPDQEERVRRGLFPTNPGRKRQGERE
jgi:hypothetical protein